MPEEEQTKERSSPDTTVEVMATPASPLTWWLSVGALVVVGGVVAAIFLSHPGDDSATHDHGHAPGVETSVEGYDEEPVEEFVHHVHMVHEELQPLVESLDLVLPPDGSAPSGDTVDAAEVDGWRETVHEAAHHFDDIPVGDAAGYNVARTGLSNAVDLLGSSVAAYASAQDADGTQQATLFELSSDLRTQAVNAWSVAATQLDLISTESGHGHVHLYLPAAPDSGALEPDDSEVGAPGEGGESGDHH